MFTIVFAASPTFLPLALLSFLSVWLLCFFFNTDFNLITLLFELMAAESFCSVGVIGTDGKLVTGDDCDVLMFFEPADDGGGSKRQNIPE